MNRTTESNDADTLRLIGDLERSTAEAVRSARASARIDVRLTVIVEPGSVSQRLTPSSRLQGVTGDVSASGALVLTPRPLQLGDIYLLTFDPSQLDVPPTYAICLRGRVVRPDAYEAGVKFLTPIDLSGFKSTADLLGS